MCGLVLQILDGVTGDMRAWHRDGGACCISPQALNPAETRTLRPKDKDTGIGASVLGTLPGVGRAVPWQEIGQDWRVLLETIPKVQATGCRCARPPCSIACCTAAYACRCDGWHSAAMCPAGL